MKTVHVPVLLQEIIDNGNLTEGSVVFDGTLGGGGYSQVFSEIIGKDGLVVATDLDGDAIKRANLRTYKSKTLFVQDSYSSINSIAEEHNLEFDLAVLDLGLSSDQLDQSKRGFSFKDRDEPLDMSFSTSDDRTTAQSIVNEWDEENLADIIFGFGGEKCSRLIAKNIVARREESEIKTVGELLDIIDASVPDSYKKRRTHPATKTFQALRIVTNSEWQHIENFLERAPGVMKDGGIIAIVSFHSGEDRVIKHTFKKWHQEEVGTLVSRKAIKPTAKEVRENPRSRSAILRVIQINKQS